MEPRRLFSADAAALFGLPVALDGRADGAMSAMMVPTSSSTSHQVTQSVASAPDAGAQVGAVQHVLVFVDAGVPQADDLIQSIKAKSSDGQIFDVVTIQSGEDGLARITAELQQRTDLDAVHILSHGDTGGLQVGSTRLDQSSLMARLGEVSSWGNALTADADFMLYGCDLAASDTGRQLVDQLAQLTGADVAASTDLTGAQSLGGDWVLEYQVGHVDSAAIGAASELASWEHVLVTANLQQGVVNAATGQTYSGTTDIEINSGSPGTVVNANTNLVFDDGGRQALIKFDLSQIPAGSAITSASLTMYLESTGVTLKNWEIYRVQVPWGSSSTWNGLSSGLTIGSDTAGSPSDSVSIDALFNPSGSETFGNNASMRNDVASFLTGNNYGWALVTTGSNDTAASSSENSTVSRRPLLTLVYTEATTTAVDLNGAGSGINNTATLTEGGAAINIASAATITAGTWSTDRLTATATTLTGMTVTLNSPQNGGVYEALNATSLAGGITQSYNSSTGVLTLSGTTTAANYQTVLRSIQYSNTSDDPTTTRTINVVATDSSGRVSASTTATVTVTAVNDAPTATITPTSYSATEQTSLTLQGTGLSIADVDAASATVQATLSVVSGTLTVSAGTTGVTVSNSGTASVTLSGTIAQINNLLAGSGSGGGAVSYLLNSNTPPATDTLTLTASDLGNTGTGGTRTGSDTATINITAVNDAPTATITPTSYSATEQTSLTLQGTGLAIADVDAASTAVQAALSVVSGTLTVSAGTTGATVSNSGTASVTLSGTIAQINNLLAGSSGAISYILTSNTPPATDTLTLTASDLGNTGTGGTLTGSDSATINITAVNDAPTATITPTTYSATEQTSMTLQGTGLSIADVDAASTTVQATLGVVSGTLTVSAGTTGVTVSNSGASAVTLSGTITQINNLLAGSSGTISYLINSNTPPATDTLTLTVSDLGNTGTGGTRTGSDTATINITAVNDAPVASDDTASTNPGTPVNVIVKANDADPDDTVASLTVTVISSSAGTTATAQLNGSIDFDPGLTSGAQTVVYQLTDAQGLSSTATLTVNVAPNTPPTGADGSVYFNEDAGYTLQMADFGFADADAGQTCAGIQIETLPAAGRLTLNGVAVSAGDLVSTSDITGGRLVFMPTTNEAGSPYASCTFKVQDNMGAFSTAAYTFTFHVDAVNDAPVNAVPDAQTIDEDTTLTFSSANGNLITIADLDAGSGQMSVTLGVTNGTLTLSGTANLTFSAGSNASSSMGLIGTVADINAALAGMTYTPDANDNGTATLSLLTTDQGNFGTGGTLSALSEVTINVVAINDAPTATITPTSYSATEQTVLNLAGTGLAISDVDAGGLAVQAILSVTDGTLDVSEGASGVTVINSGTSSVTLVGTITQINDLLAGTSGGTATYTINADFSPSTDGLTLTINDLGNTGAGGNGTSSDTATIGITAINDAPTLVATANNPGFTEAAGAAVQAPAVNVFSGTLINPVEADQTIIGLTFTITGLQDGSHETITVDGTRIVLDASHSSITSGHGVDYAVTVGSGSATVVLSKTAGLSSADAQTLVNGIAYQNDHVDNPTAGVRLFTLTQIQDSGGTTNGGADASALANASSVTVNPVNDAPSVTTYTVSGVENNAVMGQVVASDVDGDALTYSQASNPANGSVSFASDGSFSYTPVASFYGTDSFTVAVSDGNGSTSTTTVVITVTAEPVAAGGAGSSGSTQGTVIAAPAVPPVALNQEFQVAAATQEPTLFGQVSDVLDEQSAQPSSIDAVSEEPLQVIIRKSLSLTKAVSLAGATSGTYQGSPALFAANQAGGFVFRLEAGGLNLDLLGVNSKWLEISKLAIDVPGHPLELSFSPSTERRGHAGPSLSFAETNDDKVAKVEKLAVQMSGTALSVGTVWWAARVSGLIASLMISTPAWRSLDPLPVLGVSDAGELDEDEYEDDFEDDDDSDLTDDEREMGDKADQMFSSVDAGETVIGERG